MHPPERSPTDGSPTGVPDPAAPDADLVRRLADGDQRALATLYDRHAPKVLGLARQVLRDQARAEEITQAVFLRLWEHPERFDPARGHLGSYLCTMAHTRAIDLLRADRARQRREENDHRRGVPLRTSGEQELAALRIEVRDALDRLGDAERTVLVLAYFGGYTYREVAELIGEPEGTVKSRIRTALTRLRTTVGAGVEP